MKASRTYLSAPVVFLAAILASACASSGGVAPASAQAPTHEIVTMQLDSAVSFVRPQGFALTGPYRGGSLGSGAQEALTLELAAGRTYFISGACDQGCADLDLLLEDPSGAEIGSDYAPDDVPIIITTVPRSASYRLVVTMASCSVAPCGWGVAVLAQ